MENTNKVVNEEVTDPNKVVEEETTTQAGDKTPPNELLRAKQVEVERRRIAEDKVKLLEEKLKASPSNEELEPEGKIFKQEFSDVKSDVAIIKEEAARIKVFETYPDLKDKEAEFDDYRNLDENKGMSLSTSAKAFMAENGMLGSTRVGLEKTTGGDRTAPTQGMTVEEVKHLRQNNYKEYVRLLMEDKLKIAG